MKSKPPNLSSPCPFPLLGIISTILAGDLFSQTDPFGNQMKFMNLFSDECVTAQTHQIAPFHKNHRPLKPMCGLRLRIPACIIPSFLVSLLVGSWCKMKMGSFFKEPCSGTAEH